MKKATLKTAALAVAIASSMALVGCDVDKVEEGAAPAVDVDVEATPGEAPEYEVAGPEVDVGSTTATVPVPAVDVDMAEVAVPVPTIDASVPDAEAEAEVVEE